MMSTLRQLLLPSSPGAFRLWLAMVVVFHHVSRLEVGKAPVIVFFALSGYWVFNVWTARYEQSARPWLTFLISRWWRIAPVMLLAALLSLGALALVGSADLAAVRSMMGRQAFSTLFGLGYAQMPVRPLGPAWSLDIEMQFYLVAPLLVVCVRRLSWIAALCLGYGTYTLGIMVYPELVLSSFLFPFLLGMVAARHRWTVPARVGNISQGLAIALVAAAWLSPWKHLLLDTANDNWWPLFNILLTALVLPQALVSVQSRGGARDQLCADQSYIVYMLHWPAILVLRGVEWPAGWGWWAGLAGLSLLTLLGCIAVLRWFDRPLNRARARWVSAQRQPVAGGVESAAAPAPTKEGDSAPVFA